MCGIAGIVRAGSGLRDGDLGPIAAAMGRRLAHRGPDDSGIWVDAEKGCALSHRRLSILDLSPEGHQPMVSASGRHIIAFNGEVFNFAAIREDLAKAGSLPALRGHSDTEIMLAAIEAWGLEKAVRSTVRKRKK